MRIFLYGISAFSYWLSAPTAPAKIDHVTAGALRNCEPTPDAVQYLAERFPQIPQPYHVSVSTRTKKRLAETTLHASTLPLPGKPFCRIADGVYAPIPELCFIQIARYLDRSELIKAGDALCGTFFIDPDARNGLGRREPVTSKQRIKAFLARTPGMTGAKAARRAADHLIDNAASPPEVFLAMVLGLPHRYGGYQLPGITANKRIRPSRKARFIAKRETLVPDVLCEAARLDIEYDSNAEHASPSQLTRDAQKRLAMEADGYKVITVTAQQIRSKREMRNIADQSHRRMGARLRVQSAAFRQEHDALFRMGWSFERYHRRAWLNGDQVSENPRTGRSL